MIHSTAVTAYQALTNSSVVPQGGTLPGTIDAANHVLSAAATPAVATGGAGAGVGAAVLLALYVWYEFKHKGWDWMPFLTGLAFSAILSGTSTGGPVIHGIGSAVAAIFNGIFSALGSAVG